jgi:hypothetical protein
MQNERTNRLCTVSSTAHLSYTLAPLAHHLYLKKGKIPSSPRRKLYAAVPKQYAMRPGKVCTNSYVPGLHDSSIHDLSRLSVEPALSLSLYFSLSLVNERNQKSV